MSKFLRDSAKQVLVRMRVLLHEGHRSTKYSQMVPPNQYDTPFPKRLQISYVLRTYWETIPLFVSTATAMGILVAAVIWTCKNKVDVLFTTHSRNNISRTMDLRHPTIHKFVIINQKYRPWPEMQAVLDKMRIAEKRLIAKAESCSLAF